MNEPLKETKLTAEDRRRYAAAKDRVIECINDMVYDGYTGGEIYLALSDRAAVVLRQGVPDFEERSYFIRKFYEKAMQEDGE